MSKKKDKEDIFEKSAMQVIHSKDSLKEMIANYPQPEEPLKEKTDTITDANIDFGMNNNTKSKKKTWDDLTDAFSGELTEKFYDIMRQLPDREYIRVYLKMAEFFKPKITRQVAGISGGEDEKIEVVIRTTQGKLEKVKSA